MGILRAMNMAGAGWCRRTSQVSTYLQAALIGWALCCCILLGAGTGYAEEEPQRFVLRLGAGVAVPTQKVLKTTDSHTDVGSLVNFEALYIVKEWLRVGIMYQYTPFDVDLASGSKFGTFQTHTVLPIVELRPTRKMISDQWLTGMTPYVALGVGANWHLFKTGNANVNNAVSIPATLAFRVASGFDVPITEYVSFNAEVAWQRDAGDYKVNGTAAGFDASAFNALAGLRLHY